MARASLRFVERFLELPKINEEIFTGLRSLTRATWDTKLIADILTQQGFDVEGITVYGAGFETVVVGQIIEALPHPNAQKLKVCKVQCGETEPRQIVCGAPNARAGLYVAVALPGTKLPTLGSNGQPLEIKVSKIRDVESHGMLCSRAELGLPVNSELDGDGIWELTEDVQGGKPAEYLQQHLGEPVFDVLEISDVLLELNVLANRPDMRSQLGVAREIAAGLLWRHHNVAWKNIYTQETPLKPTQLIEQVFQNHSITKNGITLSVDNSLGVSAFFILVDDLKVTPSPAWLRNLLESNGQPSINNVVDISNYVLLAYGQPSHAFDWEKIANTTSQSKKMLLRQARAGENFVGLDGKTRELTPADAVVADISQVQALLGILGGEHSKVDFTTHTTILEFANPHHVAVRRTSRRHGRATESSQAFEKGIDAQSRFSAACEIIALIQKLSGGRVCGAIHSAFLPLDPEAERYATPSYRATTLGPAEAQGICVDFSEIFYTQEALPQPFLHPEWQTLRTHKERVINFKNSHVEKVLGAPIVNAEECKKILESLGIKEIAPETFQVPRWRLFDLCDATDLVEEVIRVKGIDLVPAVPLLQEAIPGTDDPHFTFFDTLAERLVALGYHETISFHFLHENAWQKLNFASPEALGLPLKLMNPIFRDHPYMHTTLIPDLLIKVGNNLRYGTQRGQLFALARTFHNATAQGAVFCTNELTHETLAHHLSQTMQPEKLYDYSPCASLSFSSDTYPRPAETPRLAGIVFGPATEKSWWNTTPQNWTLHHIMAHVRETLRAGRVYGVEFQPLPTHYPWVHTLHPCQAAGIVVNNTLIGWVGALHPQVLRNYEIDTPFRVFAFELNLALAMQQAKTSCPSAEGFVVQRLPLVERDFAFVADERLAAGKLLEVCQEASRACCQSEGIPAQVKSATVFDVYRGKGLAQHQKSLAVRLVLAPTSRTLTDNEIQKIMQKVIHDVKEQLNADLRS